MWDYLFDPNSNNPSNKESPCKLNYLQTGKSNALLRYNFFTARLTWSTNYIIEARLTWSTNYIIEHHPRTRLGSDTNWRTCGTIQKTSILGGVAQIFIYSRLSSCLADVRLFIRPKYQQYQTEHHPQTLCQIHSKFKMFNNASCPNHKLMRCFLSMQHGPINKLLKKQIIIF